MLAIFCLNHPQTNTASAKSGRGAMDLALTIHCSRKSTALKYQRLMKKHRRLILYQRLILRLNIAILMEILSASRLVQYPGILPQNLLAFATRLYSPLHRAMTWSGLMRGDLLRIYSSTAGQKLGMNEEKQSAKLTYPLNGQKLVVDEENHSAKLTYPFNGQKLGVNEEKHSANLSYPLNAAEHRRVKEKGEKQRMRGRASDGGLTAPLGFRR